MSLLNDYVHLPAAPGPETTSKARFVWITILTIAAVGASFALSCVTPFAALAVALAGTVGLRTSLRVVTAVWFANQVVGFVFFHFPLTANTFLRGIAEAVAALAATVVASAMIKYASSAAAPLRLGVTFLFSFAVYETTMFTAAIFLGGFETFGPSIIGLLAWINAAALLGLIVLNEIVAALCRPLFGNLPRLARSS